MKRLCVQECNTAVALYHVTVKVTFVSKKCCAAFESSSDKKTSSHGPEHILILFSVKRVCVFLKYILNLPFVSLCLVVLCATIQKKT